MKPSLVLVAAVGLLVGAIGGMAGVIQLSDPDDYEGGDLIVRGWDAKRIIAPRARGSFVAFPGWSFHHVEPVTSGVRWSLCWNGFGPPLR